MDVLFCVRIGSGDVDPFVVASDGVIFREGRPMDKTGFRLVGDHVEYFPNEILVGWMSRMNFGYALTLPLEIHCYQKDGYCHDAFWTRDEQAAKDLGRACKFAKEQASKPSQIS